LEREDSVEFQVICDLKLFLAYWLSNRAKWCENAALLLKFYISTRFVYSLTNNCPLRSSQISIAKLI